MKAGKYIRYCLEYAVIWCVVRFVYVLPMRFASHLFAFIAGAVGPRLRVSRVADTNLRYALPDLDCVERKRIIVDMWRNLGRTMAEFPHFAFMSPEVFSRYVTVEGQEHFDKMYSDGTGGFFLSAHLANWEIFSAFTKIQGHPLTLIYRAANNPFVEKELVRLRSASQENHIPKGNKAGLKIVRAMQKHTVIGALMDQKTNDGIVCQFFGYPAMTASAIASLALRYNYPIVMSRIIRDRNDPLQFTACFSPPIDLDAYATTEALTQHINDIIESWVRDYPEQWFWVHKRWNWDAIESKE